MGSRARRRGISNAVLRAARAASSEQDEQAAEIAQRVYNVAVELKTERAPEPLPLAVLAPLIAAAEGVAPGALRLAGREVTEKDSADVAAYLVAGFREMAIMLDPVHFESWRDRSNEAGVEEAAPTSLTD